MTRFFTNLTLFFFFSSPKTHFHTLCLRRSPHETEHLTHATHAHGTLITHSHSLPDVHSFTLPHGNAIHVHTHITHLSHTTLNPHLTHCSHHSCTSQFTLTHTRRSHLRQLHEGMWNGRFNFQDTWNAHVNITGETKENPGSFSPDFSGGFQGFLYIFSISF